MEIAVIYNINPESQTDMTPESQTKNFRGFIVFKNKTPHNQLKLTYILLIIIRIS